MSRIHTRVCVEGGWKLTGLLAQKTGTSPLRERPCFDDFLRPSGPYISLYLSLYDLIALWLSFETHDLDEHTPLVPLMTQIDSWF